MKILCLYNNPCAIGLFDWLAEQGHQTILCSAKLEPGWCRKQYIDLAVSYTYRFILGEEQLTALNNNVVNIHNSFLPWNRGADPNLWSIVDGTPRGVTLHYMDAGLDKGEIISQRIVSDNGMETLSSSYDNLDRAAKKLFIESFQWYRFWPGMKKKPEGSGTYHSVKDGLEIKSLIDSYNISIAEFRERLRENGRGNFERAL